MNAPVDAEATGSMRRFLRRMTGLLLGLAVPTAALSWLLGFDVIKERINGRLWCADADEVELVVNARSSGNAVRFSDLLECKRGGTIVETISEARMTTTIVGVAFAISLVLLGLLVGSLLAYAKVTRRHRTI